MNYIDDSLLFFSNPKDFLRFIEELDIYNGWKIESGLLNDRGKKIDRKWYTNKLRNVFKEKNFFRRNVSLAEVVSWLDTFSLVKRLLEKLQMIIPTNDFLQIQISVEYMIKMSKRMRVDYLIKYSDRVLLLEMRTVSNFDKVRPTWSKKFQELLIYKELLGYYQSSDKIVVFALVTLYEYISGKMVPKHINNNDNQIDFLAEYIKKYIIG